MAVLKNVYFVQNSLDLHLVSFTRKNMVIVETFNSVKKQGLRGFC